MNFIYFYKCSAIVIEFYEYLQLNLSFDVDFLRRLNENELR